MVLRLDFAESPDVFASIEPPAQGISLLPSACRIERACPSALSFGCSRTSLKVTRCSALPTYATERRSLSRGSERKMSCGSYSGFRHQRVANLSRL